MYSIQGKGSRRLPIATAHSQEVVYGYDKREKKRDCVFVLTTPTAPTRLPIHAKIPQNEGLEFLRGMVSTILIGEVLKDEPPTDNRLWGKER